MDKRKVTLIGIGMGSMETRTELATKRIKESEFLVGARRMLEAVEDIIDLDRQVFFLSYQAKEIAEFLGKQDFTQASILLSGDVGFSSGAKKLIEELTEYEVELVPGITSMVYFMSRLKMPWENVCFGSVHGKNLNTIQRIQRNRRCFFILDGTEGLHRLCEKLIYYNMKEVVLYVGENLSYPEERMWKGTPEEMQKEQVGTLAVVLVENEHAVNWAAKSIPDEAFIRSKVPMTKAEVRTVSIGKLQLEADSVVYDIGAGSGSVSIEIAMQAPDIQVYAIEKNPEAVDLLEQNKRKFGADNMEIIEGLAPQAMAGLPVPTHVFIGGSAGNLDVILQECFERNNKCRVVINAIALNTLVQVVTWIEQHQEYESDIVQLQASHGKQVGSYQLMMGQNPIYIITLAKKQE